MLQTYRQLSPILHCIALHWDYEKNKGLKPCDILPRVNKDVWWTCIYCGHSYKRNMVSQNRKNGKSLCPNCKAVINDDRDY